MVKIVTKIPRFYDGYKKEMDEHSFSNQLDNKKHDDRTA